MPIAAFRRSWSIALLTLACAALPAFGAELDAPTRRLAHDIFQQLVEINTTDSVGNVTTAAKAMKQRLLDAGFSKDDLYLGGPNDLKENLVVRYRGTGAKQPMLFIGHLDVVEAPRDEWHTDPFKFVEKDGYYYGRGTQDMKENDAIFVTDFIRLKKAGYKPDRDLILALTADEEMGQSNGVAWLLKNHPDMLKAEFALNPDLGRVNLVNGKPVTVDVSATEKLYADYQLTVTNPGGHASVPVPDNAIYHLADALAKLQDYRFAFELNAVTRAYFDRLSALESGQAAADLKAILRPVPDQAAALRLSMNPEWNSMMHTTCVATRLNAGLANNSLPQRAQAIVNCRILPGHSPEQIRRQLIGIFADAKVTVRYVNEAGAISDTAPQQGQQPPAPLNPTVMGAIEKAAGQIWPGAPVIASMSTAASDSMFTLAAGIPSYGISGIAIESDDNRMHARDERIPIDSYYKGVAFYHELIQLLSGGA